MKITIDISQSAYKGTGVARFTTGLINAILENNTEDEWTFFYSSLRIPIDAEIKRNIIAHNQHLKEINIPPLVLNIMWNKLHIMNIETFVGKQDWIISSDWTEPPSTAKKATIVHDLVFMRYPETVDSTILDVQKRRLELVKKESSVIFADSQSTKDDLIHYYKIESAKIHVAYPGVVTNKSSEEIIARTKKKYNLQKPFILAVGKIEPRKNLKKLIEAYNLLKRDDIDLVIAGPKGWDEVSSVNKNIHFIGMVTDEELFSLYSSCKLFVFPSIWEGFGYPVVEAMQLGAPVALSDTSSLSEIGSNGAGYFFDPHNVDSIKTALATVLDDKSIQQNLIHKGLAKNQQFSWTNYYNQMIQILKKN